MGNSKIEFPRRPPERPAEKLYIADCHFFHERLNVQMDFRGFSDVQEMNDHMVEQWNSRVRPRDEVFILGDFSCGRGKETADLLQRLNGHLYMIQGNHDRFLEDKMFDSSRFYWVRPYTEIRDGRRRVILCHYPVFCYKGQYKASDSGEARTFMLYGHVHDTHDEILVNHFIQETRGTVVRSKGEGEPQAIPCQMINCFCMFSDYVPLTLDEWAQVDAVRREALP